MPVTIVVGGQYGSEGKGKTVAAISLLYDKPHIVRCGGPNSGHTIDWQGQDIVLRQVPAGIVNRSANLYLAAGSVVDEDVLLSELTQFNIPRNSIMIDQRAILVCNEDIDSEIQAEIVREISSTCTGNGAALARRLMRDQRTVFANGSSRLRDAASIGCVANELHRAIDRNDPIVIEGTQGFGLSLFHAPQYPHVTSKDTTASGFVSEVGISPRDTSGIIMVVRTYPIRVGGNSGPLPFETTWDEIRARRQISQDITEYTSVTRRVRRVAQFDFDMVKLAAQYNKPNAIALLGLDLLDTANTTARCYADLSYNTKRFIRRVERTCNAPVFLFGTGKLATEYFVDVAKIGAWFLPTADLENDLLKQAYGR